MGEILNEIRNTDGGRLQRRIAQARALEASWAYPGRWGQVDKPLQPRDPRLNQVVDTMQLMTARRLQYLDTSQLITVIARDMDITEDRAKLLYNAAEQMFDATRHHTVLPEQALHGLCNGLSTADHRKAIREAEEFACDLTSSKPGDILYAVPPAELELLRETDLFSARYTLGRHITWTRLARENPGLEWKTGPDGKQYYLGRKEWPRDLLDQAQAQWEQQQAARAELLKKTTKAWFDPKRRAVVEAAVEGARVDLSNDYAIAATINLWQRFEREPGLADVVRQAREELRSDVIEAMIDDFRQQLSKAPTAHIEHDDYRYDNGPEYGR